MRTPDPNDEWWKRNVSPDRSRIEQIPCAKRLCPDCDGKGRHWLAEVEGFCCVPCFRAWMAALTQQATG